MPHPERDEAALLQMPQDHAVLCFRDRYDLVQEITVLRDGPVPLNRVDATVTVLKRERECEWFESHRLGLSFTGHIDVQERRREWKRTAVVALVAALIGGTMTMIPSVIALVR